MTPVGAASRALAGVAVVVGALVVAGAASAYFTARGAATSEATVASLAPPADVVGAVQPSPPRTVRVTWEATIAPGGPTPDGYHVERVTGSTTSPACGSSPASPLPAEATACDDLDVPPGTHIYRVVALYRTWSAPSELSEPVAVADPVLSSFTVQPASSTVTAGTPVELTVTARDQHGHVFAGHTGPRCTTFSGPGSSPDGTTPTFPPAGPCPAGSSAVSFSSGVATATVTLVRVETTQLTATDAASGASGTSASIVVSAGPADRLVLVQQPMAVAAGDPISPAVTVQVRDRFGNAVAEGGRSVSMVVASGPGGFHGSSTTTVATGSGGLATFANLVLSASGTYTIQATSSGLTPATSTTFAVEGLTYGGTGPVATRSSNGSVTVSYPAGTTDGDLLLLIQANAANQAITTPAGWTLLADQPTSSPQAARFTVWWRRAGTETSATATVTTNAQGTSLWVTRYARPAGAGQVVPVHTAPAQGLGGATSLFPPAPDVTTTGPGTMISLVTVRAPNTVGLFTPRQFALRASATSSGAGNTHPTVGVADRTVAAATSPASPTWGQTGTPAQWAFATVAFHLGT